jgi:hypothetical protein
MLPGDKDRIAKIRDVIAELEGYRETEHDRQMNGHYRHAIDRLDALVYWLTKREPPVVIRPRPPPPAPEQPVGAIVRTRKPKRR